MVKKGIGYALTIDKLVQTTEDSALCFRPFDPPLASGLLIVWKKNQVFSSAAALFLSRLQEVFQKDKREASESKE
ncbi:transcriptional regulator [Enterococcus casseliflavus]